MKGSIFSLRSSEIKVVLVITTLILVLTSEFSFATTSTASSTSTITSTSAASATVSSLTSKITSTASAKISSIASNASNYSSDSKKISYIRKAVGNGAEYSKNQSNPSTFITKHYGNTSAFSIVAGNAAAEAGMTVKYTENSTTGSIVAKVLVNNSWVTVKPMFEEAGDTLDCLSYEESLTKKFYGYYVNSKSVSSTSISTSVLKKIDEAVEDNDVVDLSGYSISSSKAKTLSYCYTLYSNKGTPIDIATKNGKIVYVSEANDVWLSSELTSSQKKSVAIIENKVVKKARRIKSTTARIRYLNSYIKNTCKYKSNKYDNDVYGVLVKHRAVCGGYAQTFYQLAVKSGISVKLRISYKHNHAWNEVKVGGKWKTVDVTWNDTTHSNRYLFSAIRHWN